MMEVLGGLDKTQPEVCAQLQGLTASCGASFPNALLFSGEPCTGRMFAARQICAALDIPSENVVIVSDRNHSYRINTALELFRKHKNNSSRSFLKENISILLQQYHGALFDGQSTTAGKKKFSDAAEVTELLMDLDSADEKNADKIADKIEKSLSPFLSSNRTSAISIGQVRAIRDWCATSSMDGVQKFVIIEGLENATDGAINALLKTLEEPPAGSHFILISANAGKIPATILSRVRKFRFKDFGVEEKRYVLGTLFVDPNKYNSLEEFFLEGSGIDDRLLLDSAKALVAKKPVDMPALVSELEKNQGWDRFFEHVINEIGSAFMEGRIEQRRAEYILDSVNDAVLKGRTFNQTKRLTFDYVVYRVQEVVK